MADRIHASAPGKLFLVGEYAVLDGAPALLAAVDRRVHVRLDPASDGRWRLDAKAIGLDSIDLGPDGDTLASHDPGTRSKLAVFAAVLHTVKRASEMAIAPQHVGIDSAAFAGDAGKLGLGSSAAVATALTAALLARAGHALDRDRIAALAIAAHRDAQRGAGSGGDVACAAYGRLISYRRDHAVTTLRWPPALRILPVATGPGASTPALIAAVRAYGERDPEGYAADLARLTTLADRAAGSLADRREFLCLAADYFAALRTLDSHARAGIVTARHVLLHDIAARHDTVFKSAGAGGGDVGLIFAHREQSLDTLGRALSDAGATLVDLRFNAPGVRLETGR